MNLILFRRQIEWIPENKLGNQTATKDIEMY